MTARRDGVKRTQAIIRKVMFTPIAGLIGTMKVTGAIAIVIIVEATLGFLGLGTQPPTPSWG